MINIKRGLDLPITGSPEQTIAEERHVRSVAVLGSDYVGMKPTMAVAVGDRVNLGQLLFTDKKNTDVRYTSPASGVVAVIHRGEKRVFQSLVIDVDGDGEESFSQYAPADLDGLTREQVQANLVQSGLWTALRTRPLQQGADTGYCAGSAVCDSNGHQSAFGQSGSDHCRAGRSLRAGAEGAQQVDGWQTLSL